MILYDDYPSVIRNMANIGNSIQKEAPKIRKFIETYKDVPELQLHIASLERFLTSLTNAETDLRLAYDYLNNHTVR